MAGSSYWPFTLERSEASEAVLFCLRSPECWICICRVLTLAFKICKFSSLAQMVKNLPAKWETWVRSLGQKDSLERGMAINPSILAWRIPWTEEPAGLQSMGSQRVGHYWAINTHTVFIQPPGPSLNSKCSNQGKEGMCRQGQSKIQKPIMQPWGRVLVPSQGIYIYI